MLLSIPLYFISCSKLSNSALVKNSPNVISKPSQIFLIVVIRTSFLVESIKLYTVDGVSPQRLDNSFNAIFRSLQTEFILNTIAFFTSIKSPRINKSINFYDIAYTHLRIFDNYGTICLKRRMSINA